MKITKVVPSAMLLLSMAFSTTAFSTVDLNKLFPTLKVVGQLDFVSIDPATCFDTGCGELLDSMCLRLVRQDQSGNTVADLAKAVPSATNGMIVNNPDGTVTYKFNIQKGYLFSLPSLAQVTGLTVKKTMERAANPAFGSPSNEGFFMSDIVGIDNVINGSATQISGISVSSDKSKVSITIKKPSGDFLQRLSLVYSCVVPENTPTTALTKPYPTAGAYTILSYPTITPDQYNNQHSGLVLVRHLLYPTWLSTQSKGQFFFVNYKFGVLPADQAPAVLAGTYDFGGYQDNTQLADLLTNHPNNLKTVPGINLAYYSLNEGRWPYCNVHARRAMNFGFNRSDYITFVAGPLGLTLVTPTDTYLPPAIPGSNPVNGSVYPVDGSGFSNAQNEMDAFLAAPESPSCNHTSNPLATAWTAGAPVPIRLVISGLSARNIEVGDYVKGKFNLIKSHSGIGFNTTVSQVGNLNVFFGSLPADYDVGSRGWNFDYVDPYDFLNTLWGQGSPYNYGFYFNPVISPALAAAALLDPPVRFTTYSGLNMDLVQDAAALAVDFGNSIFLFSDRIDPNSIGPYPEVVIREVRLKP
jgi:ABC-type oligopeptide transport system substrate-binding subunit